MKSQEPTILRATSEFVLLEHQAERAGLHTDLRFKIASNTWESFAIRKDPALAKQQRILAIRTDMHTEECAKFAGQITEGYGKGVLALKDQGNCFIKRYSPDNMRVVFGGKMFRGEYVFLRFKEDMPNKYLFFAPKTRKLEKKKAVKK